MLTALTTFSRPLLPCPYSVPPGSPMKGPYSASVSAADYCTRMCQAPAVMAQHPGASSAQQKCQMIPKSGGHSALKRLRGVFPLWRCHRPSDGSLGSDIKSSHGGRSQSSQPYQNMLQRERNEVGSHTWRLPAAWKRVSKHPRTPCASHLASAGVTWQQGMEGRGKGIIFPALEKLSLITHFEPSDQR